MAEIEFRQCGENQAGERIYNLCVTGKIVSGEPMTIDEVIRNINDQDTLRLGEQYLQRPEDRTPRHSRR